MAWSVLFASLFLLALFHSFANASGSGQFQDFCVADFNSQVFANGFACKNPNLVTQDDFFFSGLDKAADTDNYVAANMTSVTVQTLPGLNTLGISLTRFDFASVGLIPPHYHPRATEVLFVIEGTVEVVLMKSSFDPAIFSKTLTKGDVYVFPQGMLHYQYNRDFNTTAVAFSVLSSENPGTVFLDTVPFRTNPSDSDDDKGTAFDDWLRRSQFNQDGHN